MVVANTLPGSMRMLILTVGTLLLFLFYRNRIHIRSVALLLYISILVLAQMMIFSEESTDYMLLLIPILVGFAIVASVPYESFVHAYNNVVCLLAAFSLVFYIVSFAFPYIINMLPIINYHYNAPVHNAGFSVVILAKIYNRNFGIAWEPGAFSLLLGLSLFFTLYSHNRIRMSRVLLLTITILTTFSTLGYIFAAILFVVFYLLPPNSHTAFKEKRRKTSFLAAIVVVVLVILTQLLPYNIIEVVFAKLDGLFSPNQNVLINYTTQTRLDAITYPMQAFSRSPIWGIGYSDFKYMNEIQCHSVATNTILNWFALSGILLGLPCSWFYLRFVNIYCIRNNYKKTACILLMLAFVFLVSTESLLRISLIYTLIFYSCNYRYNTSSEYSYN
jgi:hypothetical protein